MTSVKEILLKVNLIHLEDHSNLYLYGDPSINYSGITITGVSILVPTPSVIAEKNNATF